MKQIVLLALATAIVGCSKSDTDSPSRPKRGEDAIGFSTTVLSRGVSITIDNIADFGVFGYTTQRDKWADVSNTVTPTLFDNVKVTRTENNWDYSGEDVNWGEQFLENFTFFGYSPFATADNGLTAPAAGSTDIPIVGFEALDDVTKHIDLLTAESRDIKPTTEPVQMKFNHALSRIGFKVFSTAASVTSVTSIKITGVKYKGGLHLDGSWNSSPDVKDFTLTYAAPVALGASAISKETAVDISAGAHNGYFMLLPQDFLVNTSSKIIFTYSVGGASLTKEYALEENWGKSKSITYIVDITTVLEEKLDVVDVIVTDWIDGGASSGDADGKLNDSYVTYMENGAPLATIDAGTQNTYVRLTQRPTSPFQAWNTKADGSGDFYSVGDELLIMKDITLYNVDNTVTIGSLTWMRTNLSGTAGSDTDVNALGNPSAYGKMFNWGSKRVYERATVADNILTGKPNIGNPETWGHGYDYTDLNGGVAAGDPCQQLGPQFMTPTNRQMAMLYDKGYTQGTYQGVYGIFLGDNHALCTDTKIAQGSLFFPAAEYRNEYDGALSNEQYAYYWLSSVDYNVGGNVQVFFFMPGYVSMSSTYGIGASVRCVSSDVKIGGTNWTTGNLNGLKSANAATRNYEISANPQDFGKYFKWGDRWVYIAEFILRDPLDQLMSPSTPNYLSSAYPFTTLTGGVGYDYIGMEFGRETADACLTLGANYKTPTAGQTQALLDSGHSYGSYRGVDGTFFGPKSASCTNDKLQDGCIFLPFAGYRYHKDATYIGGVGHYFTSTAGEYLPEYPTTMGGASSKALSLNFQDNTYTASFISEARADGASIRCIRE